MILSAKHYSQRYFLDFGYEVNIHEFAAVL